MVAYRFCRPDDAGRIVSAIQNCFNVHFEGEKASLQLLQEEIREIDLWPSNCLLASEGSEPIAVCTAAKRPREVLVQRIGVRPDFLRQGHGSHLLTSLRKKLQVLGPSRLIAEIPEKRVDLSYFFSSLGWSPEETYTDYGLHEPLQFAKKPQAVIPVTVAELLSNDLLRDDFHLPWERQSRTLQQRADQIHGWAVASLERIEAFVLFRDLADSSRRELLRTGVQNSAPEPRLMKELLLRMVVSERGPVLFPKVAENEEISTVLQEFGFRPAERWVRFGICGSEFDKE